MAWLAWTRSIPCPPSPVSSGKFLNLSEGRSTLAKSWGLGQMLAKPLQLLASNNYRGEFASPKAHHVQCTLLPSQGLSPLLSAPQFNPDAPPTPPGKVPPTV